MYAKIVSGLGQERIDVIAKNRKDVFPLFEAGHRYEIKLPNVPAFNAVLAMYWTGGHLTAQFILDDGDCLELLEQHLIEYVKPLGKETKAHPNIKSSILYSSKVFKRPFNYSDVFSQCGISYCGHDVFALAWNELLSEGAFVHIEDNPRMYHKEYYRLA